MQFTRELPVGGKQILAGCGVTFDETPRRYGDLSALIGHPLILFGLFAERLLRELIEPFVA